MTHEFHLLSDGRGIKLNKSKFKSEFYKRYCLYKCKKYEDIAKRDSPT